MRYVKLALCFVLFGVLAGCAKPKPEVSLHPEYMRGYLDGERDAKDPYWFTKPVPEASLGTSIKRVVVKPSIN